MRLRFCNIHVYSSYLLFNSLFHYALAYPALNTKNIDNSNTAPENILLDATRQLNNIRIENLKVAEPSTEGLKPQPVTRKSQKKEPRIRATPSTTTTTTTTELSSEVAVYRYKDEDDKTCILMQVDAVIEFKFKDRLGEKRATDTYVPNTGKGASKAAVAGSCGEEDSEQTLRIMWRSYTLTFNFKKTPGGERWYIQSVLLDCSSNEREFEHFRFPGRTLKFSTPQDNSFVLFPTPVGQAFNCHRELSIELTDPDTPDTTATVLLRELKTEPFMFKSENFGQPHMCSDPRTGGERSEAAPFIVGSLLAFAALCTVTGYSIYRYFKIKKVQYDTME